MKTFKIHKPLLQSIRENRRRRLCRGKGCKKAQRAAQVSEAIEDEASEDAELLLGDESTEDELADELDDDMLLGEKKGYYSNDKRFKELVERFIPDDEENLDDEDIIDTLDDDGDEDEEIDLERRHRLRGEDDEDVGDDEDDDEDFEDKICIEAPRRRISSRYDEKFSPRRRITGRRFNENFARRVDRCKKLVREAKRLVRRRESGKGRRRIAD